MSNIEHITKIAALSTLGFFFSDAADSVEAFETTTAWLKEQYDNDNEDGTYSADLDYPEGVMNVPWVKFEDDTFSEILDNMHDLYNSIILNAAGTGLCSIEEAKAACR